jgi:hypothetical protein
MNDTTKTTTDIIPLPPALDAKKPGLFHNLRERVYNLFDRLVLGVKAPPWHADRPKNGITHNGSRKIKVDGDRIEVSFTLPMSAPDVMEQLNAALQVMIHVADPGKFRFRLVRPTDFGLEKRFFPPSSQTASGTSPYGNVMLQTDFDHANDRMRFAFVGYLDNPEPTQEKRDQKAGGQ